MTGNAPIRGWSQDYRQHRVAPFPRGDMGLFSVSTTFTTSGSVTKVPVGSVPPNGSAGVNSIWQVSFAYDTASPNSTGEAHNLIGFVVGDDSSSGDTLRTLTTEGNPGAGETVSGAVDFQNRALYEPTPGQTLYVQLAAAPGGIGDNHSGDFLCVSFHFVIVRMA